MSSVATLPLMTAEEMLALPDDGVERWLIRGQLRESRNRGEPREIPMTIRNRFHSRVLIRVGRFLDVWLDEQPMPRGQILGGEAGVRLRRDPDTTVGIDVVYFSVETMTSQTGETTIIEGVPILVVEILSPNDTLEDVHEKINTYLDAGVKLVWVIDPYDRTVRIYRPGEAPAFVNDQQELSGEPHLPGFRVEVARLFE